MSTFWTSNTIEPKKSFRWVGYINLQKADGSEVGPQPFLVSKFTKPTFTLENETIINKFTSETSIVIKNYVWDDISISMIDVENDELNVSNALYSWLTGLGYEPAQSVNKLSKLFTNLYNKKMSITLEHINSEGQAVERWSFIKPQPTSINFGGELSYTSDELMEVTMGITYVAAKYEKLSPGGFLGNLLGGATNFLGL